MAGEVLDSGLISPYGGRLSDLLVAPVEREDYLIKASGLPHVQLTQRNLCDLELLATGGFSPLDRFIGRNDYQRILGEMRLADGTLFPIPVTLAADPSPSLKLDAEITL